MATPTPYDRTTPPTILQTKPLPKSPRKTTSTGASRYAGNPRDLRPAAYPHTPRPAPRGCDLQNDSYEAFTMDVYLSSSSPAVQEVAHSSKLQAQRKLPLPKFTRRKPEMEMLRPLTPLHIDTSSAMSKQLPSFPPTNKAGPIAKAAAWTFEKRKKKKCRPSVVFNMNFSFNIARRRGSSDHSPQVSPRTSISSASIPLPQLTEESFKRQRVDSTGADVAVPIPFRKPALVTSTRGLPVPIPPLSLSPSPPSTPCDPHPGQLVDFSHPQFSSPASEVIHARDVQHGPWSEYNLRLSNEAYHDYLATSHRRKSFPVGEWAARRVREEFALMAKLEKLDTDAQNFRAGRKRVYTVDRQERTWRDDGPPYAEEEDEDKEDEDKEDEDKDKEEEEEEEQGMSPATPKSVMGMGMEMGLGGVVPLRRSTSDPSTEAFLTHVRASLEKRASKSVQWADYSVFADEIEKGFLDDAPL
ncbi:hypothetical protein EJ02DRAFT_418521 [Clathrospora elynae]|uniref:Uncharacterized protein n=1 Tax=Clathrospora elynae TaxID=706981 RepID=A0A6A5T3Y1_9PLEO|nr:hypothetical protein EJ02DRAFT_418521 [Clathrospora elynae]